MFYIVGGSGGVNFKHKIIFVRQAAGIAVKNRNVQQYIVFNRLNKDILAKHDINTIFYNYAICVYVSTLLIDVYVALLYFLLLFLRHSNLSAITNIREMKCTHVYLKFCLVWILNEKC